MDAAMAAEPPPPALIAEAEDLSAWVGEPILWGDHEVASGELEPDRMRAIALAQARLEASMGLERPSVGFRRSFGFMLGLSRMISTDPVLLADGTQLAEHQVEVLEAVLSHNTQLVEGTATDLHATHADPNADRRLWLEHATGAGKSVVAASLVEAARTGAVLILTHRSNLVEQFRDELTLRGYRGRLIDIDNPLLEFHNNPVVITTYQYWSRSWTEFDPELFTLAICDEVHQTLGEKTSNAIRGFEDIPVVGLTATGTLLAKDVRDLFPHQVSSFDLEQAAHAGVIAPLRCLRVPPPLGMQTLEGVRQRAGDFDTDQLAETLDRDPLNYACARLYRDTFGDLSGVIYAAGVRHAERLAVSFIAAGVSAAAVSGQTPKEELNRVLREYEAGRLRVIINAQLLVEGWNSPRATVCMHLAPTASKRVYQQRIGRVTRRSPDKSAGIVVDFVEPAYANDGRIVTLHSLLDRDLYRAGAPVTLGADGTVPEQDPPIDWQPNVTVPVTSDERRRRLMLRQNWQTVTTDLLGTEDRLEWAQAAGRAAHSPQQLRRSLDRLREEDPGLTVACLQQAAIAHDGAVQQMATDRLAAIAPQQPLAWQAICDLAISTDQASLQRRLAHKAIELAADGAADTVAGAHTYLLDMARVDRPVFERVARRGNAVRRIVGNGRLPDNPNQVEDLVLRAMRGDQLEAVALMVAVSANRPRTEAVVLEALTSLCPAPTDLARDLQRARKLA